MITHKVIIFHYAPSRVRKIMEVTTEASTHSFQSAITPRVCSAQQPPAGTADSPQLMNPCHNITHSQMCPPDTSTKEDTVTHYCIWTVFRILWENFSSLALYELHTLGSHDHSLPSWRRLEMQAQLQFSRPIMLMCCGVVSVRRVDGAMSLK